MIVKTCGKTCVIEDDFASGVLRFQLKPDDRKNPGIPTRRAPGLHNSLVWNQFHASADNHSTEQGESATRFGVNLGRHTGERCELLCVQQNFINALGLDFVVDFLMK